MDTTSTQAEDYPRWLLAGDTALILELGNRVDPEINAAVMAWTAGILDQGILGVQEVVPAFRSLSIYFDPLVTDHEAVKLACERLDARTSEATKPRNTWFIPTCYDLEFGLDLVETAETLDLKVEQVIAKHKGGKLRVYVLGFMPGFSFLGGLDADLNLPRRKSPRTLVPRGSVAIAMGLGGVYPFDSPGGWHVLGKTPTKLYDPDRDPAIFFAPGDAVQFSPINRDTYDRLNTEGVTLDQLRGEQAFG